MTEFVASPERLIIGALLGFAVLLFLIIKLKIQPFIAIMSSALIIGLVSGMPFSMITDTLAEGVGNTLQTIAILIGLGSMFGAILQVSGGVGHCGYAAQGVWREESALGIRYYGTDRGNAGILRIRSADPDPRGIRNCPQDE